MHTTVGGHGDHGLVLRLGFVLRIGGGRQLHIDALLKHGRDDHHDDEQHQHHVNQRSDVDVGLDTTF
jgi:hypothetical protein